VSVERAAGVDQQLRETKERVLVGRILRGTSVRSATYLLCETMGPEDADVLCQRIFRSGKPSPELVERVRDTYLSWKAAGRPRSSA
jgi:hypothetical protein